MNDGGMLTKRQGRPLWYKAWLISVAIAAIFVLVRVYTTDELQRTDYMFMVYTNVSLLLDMFIFRRTQKNALE